jgi:hypothetical protein
VKAEKRAVRESLQNEETFVGDGEAGLQCVWWRMLHVYLTAWRAVSLEALAAVALVEGDG